MLSAFTLGLFALVASSEVSASPKPVPITLQSRKTPRGQSSGLRRRALSAISVPLDDFFLGTDLQWFGNISGTSRGPFLASIAHHNRVYHSGNSSSGRQCRVRYGLFLTGVCEH